MKILLTGSRSFVACDVARNLHRQKHTVFTADSVSFDYTRFSRSVEKYFRISSARFATEDFVAEIIDIAKKEGIDLIIPLGEEALYLAAAGETIQSACPSIAIHSGNFESLDTLHDKAKFHDIALSLGLKTPRAAVVDSLEEVLEFQKNLGRKIVLKPVYSRFGSDCMEFDGTNVGKLETVPWGNGYIAEEFVDGEPMSSYSYDASGDVVFYSGGGVKTTVPCAMPCPNKTRTPEIVMQADARIREKLGYGGQLGLDVIKREDEYYLLEANPRATIGYALLDRNKIQSRQLLFILAVSLLIQKGSVGRAFKNFIFYPDILFRWSDPLPALASQLGGLKEYLDFRKRYQHHDIRRYASFDMEFNGPKPKFAAEEAVERDSAGIASLLDNLPAPGPMKMVFTRKPDALASLKSDGEQTQVGVVKDETGKVAIMGAISSSNFFVHGEPQKLGYVSDLRKSREFPYKIPWLEMFVDEYMKNNDDDFLFCSIMRSNKRALEVFTKPRPGIPRLDLACRYTLYVVNLKKISPPRLDPGLCLLRLSDCEQEIIDRTQAFIENEGKGFDLFPKVDIRKPNFLGVAPQNSYVLLRGNEVMAFASVNDQKHKKQFIVKHYAWYLRALKLLNPFIRSLGLMPLPQENEVIDCPALSLVLSKDDDETIYQQIIQMIAAEMRQYHGMFMIALADQSAHTRIFKNMFNFTIRSNLYVADISQKNTKLRKTYTETSVLF